MIKINDFVVLTEKSNGVEINSVGFVEDVKRTKAKVFFIGFVIVAIQGLGVSKIMLS